MADQLVAKPLILVMLLLQACFLCSIANGSRSPLIHAGSLNAAQSLGTSQADNIPHPTMDLNKALPRMLITSRIDYEDPEPNVSHNLKGRSPSIDHSSDP